MNYIRKEQIDYSFLIDYFIENWKTLKKFYTIKLYLHIKN